MSKCKRNSSLWGIFLVLIGLILLLGTLDILNFHWSLILIIIGAGFFILAISSEDKGGVFPGTILLLIGLLYFLRYYNRLEEPMSYLWPVFPLIIGIAFLVLFIFRPRDWGLLIPSGILLLFGLIFLLYNYGLMDYHPIRVIWEFWPLILVIVGIRLILPFKRKG